MTAIASIHAPIMCTAFRLLSQRTKSWSHTPNGLQPTQRILPESHNLNPLLDVVAPLSQISTAKNQLRFGRDPSQLLLTAGQER